MPSAARSAAVALLLCACSNGGSGGDAGPALPDPAFFGLADRRCLYYADDSKVVRYTVEILKDETSIAGVQAWHLIHRLQGLATLEQWVEATESEYRMHRRQTFDRSTGAQPLYRYNPPPVLAAKTLADGSTLETTTTTIVSGSGGDQTLEQTVRVNAVLSPAPFEAGGQSVTPLQLLISTENTADHTTVVDKAWFVEQTGFVRLKRSSDEQFTLDHVSDGPPACTL